MKREEFNKVVEHAQQRSRDVLLTKNDEYASTDEVFANFKQATGISFHTLPEKVTWEFLTKHLQSVKDIIEDLEKGKLPTRRLIDEKLGDIQNYLLLLEGMLVERIENDEFSKKLLSLQHGDGNQPIILTEKDTTILVNNIINPPEPPDSLKQAWKNIEKLNHDGHCVIKNDMKNETYN